MSLPVYGCPCTHLLACSYWSCPFNNFFVSFCWDLSGIWFTIFVFVPETLHKLTNGFLLSFKKAVICLHRKVSTKDHKLVYWVAGGASGLSVLLEKKARRSELALYVLPRAGESLWYILVNRRLIPDIKNAEVLGY